MPEHAHSGDAGVDLHCREAVDLGPGESLTVPTGVAIAIPDGFVGLVAPRSGLASRHGLSIVNAPGIVDSGYRGEIKVILINHGDDAVRLERGDRIAQLVVVPVLEQEMVEVDALPESARGERGLGSTGT